MLVIIPLNNSIVLRMNRTILSNNMDFCKSRNLKYILGYFWHITDFHLDTNFSSNVNGKLNDQREYFIGDYAYDVCWGKAQGTVYILGQ